MCVQTHTQGIGDFMDKTTINNKECEIKQTENGYTQILFNGIVVSSSPFGLQHAIDVAKNIFNVDSILCSMIGE